MNLLRRLALALALLVLVAASPFAWAAEGETAPAAKAGPGQVLAGIALALLLTAGLGCAVAVLRVVLPRPVARADRALAALTTARLLLTGVVPVLGVALLGAAVAQSGVPALGGVWAVALGLPALLLAALGALAALPHLGGALMKRGAERSPLARAVVGALVLGLAAVALAWLLRHAALVVLLLLLGWFFAAGVGAWLRAPMPGPTGPDTAAD